MRKTTKVRMVALLAACALLAGVVAFGHRNFLAAAQKDGEEGVIHFEILLPEEAVLLIDGDRMTQTGARRYFKTPPVAAGVDHVHAVKATVGDTSIERKIRLRHGGERTFDLRPAFGAGTGTPGEVDGTTPSLQVPIPKIAANVPGPAPGPMTKAYVQMVGRMAYVWGWPLVYVYNQRTELTKVPEPLLLNDALPLAPMNQVVMLTGYISPAERYIGDPNQDVVYGLGYLSLAKEPVVVQVPDFGDRFWTFPVYDARTDQISQLGQQYGTKPGFYMVVGPDWKGATPRGIAGVVRSSTAYAVTMPRIFMDDTAEDRAAIQPALSKISIYPLSQFDGKTKTKDWSKLPVVNKKGKPEKYSTTQPPWVDPATFFDELPAVMKEVPPMPGEEALYKWIGSVLDAAAKDPEVMKTLRETAFEADKELVAPMMRWRFNGQPAGNGWTSPANNGAFGTDYIHRMGAVKADPYDNKRNETMYFYTDNDSELKQLEGKSSYAVTFPKGQLPPVKGFWSLTMYDPEHYFHPNDLKRYALGTKNKSLKYNADGGLTIYLGNKSPGKEKESNWLPAPAGEFSVWLRAYWPDKAILEGKWRPPVIEVVK